MVVGTKTSIRLKRHHRDELATKTTQYILGSSHNIGEGDDGRVFQRQSGPRSQKTEIWIPHPYLRHHTAQLQRDDQESRPLTSVIVENGIKQALIDDVIQFLQDEAWYGEKGIPYRRGYPLYGPPGCGKTSLVTALAGELRLPIVLVALGSKHVDDDALLNALSGAPRDSIVLIEDVDFAFIEVDNAKDPMQT